MASAPRDFVRLGGLVLFKADDSQTGDELHAVPLRLLDDYAIEGYGEACPGTGGSAPTIAANGTPRPGGGFALQLDEALPLAPAALLLSPGAAWLSLGSCALHVGVPLFTVPVGVDAAGRAALPVPVPAAAAGAKLDFQYAVLDPRGGLAGAASATAGLEVVLGS
ncbi:MAG: hypothetical protein AAF628_10535 [Planctomycetota bacterium]